jgi:TPR repeat protein
LVVGVSRMYGLRYLYAKGWGVAQDHAQARQWHQKAADASDAAAMNEKIRY